MTTLVERLRFATSHLRASNRSMTPRRTSLYSIVAALSLAHALGAQSARGTLKGRVTGPTGEALAGASVTVTGTQASVTARADGSYQLVLIPGRYEVRARLLGYSAVTDSVTIAADVVTNENLQMQNVTTTLEAIAVLGTRGEQRSVMTAAVPVDVLGGRDLVQSGRTETAQMIQAAAPSFNFPRTTIGDGTDHIRPASLRGLSPDETLVLVNGKRRHTSSLVNLNGFVGRGSEAVDLDAIPASMIDHIEILRDGAAAQYGSDAIAGVINIVLKSGAPASFSVEHGQNVTTYNRGANATNAFTGQTAPISAHDGDVTTTTLNYGWTNGRQRFIDVGGEVRNRLGTNRSIADTRPQYFADDPRNNLPPTIHFWQGDSYNRDVDVVANAGQAFDNGIELYAFGDYGHRRGASAGMWRRPNDDRTVRALFPDGFLPFIKSNITDASGSAGIRGQLASWQWDLGTVYGRNTFGFGVDNSANVSIGPSSKTSFDAGSLHFGQSTTTLDLSREVRAPWNQSIHLAAGAEYRADRYEITAGDSDSYRNGKTPVLDPTGTPTTRLGAAGAQVFPGFRPADAGVHTRENSALYADVESNRTSKLLVDLAGRFEHYTDFGSTTNGKIAARYEISDKLSLRGAASTGFRAPSLGQEFFSSTATNFINGAPFDIRTFPVGTAEARLLGARDLKPERSVNLSAGFAAEPVRGLGFTADFYRININDRIVLSDNFTGDSVQAILGNAGLAGVGGGRYFSNAIDTRSNGVDVVGSYDVRLAYQGLLRLSTGYNHNDVKVTHVESTPASLSQFQEVLFGRVERARIEKGNPRDNFFVSSTYSRRALELTARTQRYGQVSIAGTTPTNATGTLDQTYGAKWISDVSGSYTIASHYTLTIGADNVFDVYPDRNLNPGNPTTGNGGISNFGIFPYNGISPFGFNGRFVYTKVAFGL
jgi:iron complex outermembrane receptor protein